MLGCGSWGTAITLLLARNGHEVWLLGKDEEEVEMLKTRRENLRYLPGFLLPAEVQFGFLAEAEVKPDMTVVAVPAQAVREVLTQLPGFHPWIVLASKGLEPGTGKTMAQVAEDARPDATLGALSGPNLAVEIARGIPTVAVCACSEKVYAERARDAFSCGSFRVSISDDVMGVELGGALKNVLAIGAGMSDGLGFGDNTKGAFLSRGLMEMAKLGCAMGGRAETFLGPAGVGDLFATAASSLSRNYRLGRALGEGKSLHEAIDSLGQVAEGVPTSESVALLARRFELELPVFAAVEAVLRARISPKQAVAMLMDRTTKLEDFLG